MSKLYRIVFPLITVVLILAAVFITAAVAGVRLRTCEHFVVVDDEFYDRCISLSSDYPDIKIIKRSESFSALQIKKHEPIPILAASIEKQSTLKYLDFEENLNDVLRYEIKAEDLLPTVNADFKNADSKENSVLSPDLSIWIAESDSIGEGKRALPVNGVYAGDENYSFRKREYAACRIYNDSLKNTLNDFCTKAFSVEEQNGVSEIEQNLQKPVFIASVGDIMVARGVQDILINEKNGLDKVFTDTLPVLENNDFTMGNLEGVVTDSWKNAIKTYTFKFNKKVLPFLKAAGFDYLMMTNNHCYDYGESGFQDTLKAFKEYDIPSSGIGNNIEEASQFYHINLNGLNVAVISCGAYPVERSGFDGSKTAVATETKAGILWKSDELLKSIEEQKKNGCFVIVNVHGGEEYHFSPNKVQRQFYEALCDSGADIVFGSHPHVLQPTEWYKHSLIVYSQGNFIFNGMSGMQGAEESEIVRVGVLDGHIAYVEQYPAHLHETSVSLQ